MKRNYSKFIVVLCGVICMSVLSGCCSLFDCYGPLPPPSYYRYAPPPSYYRYAPPPPHRYHYVPRRRYHHPHCQTDVPVSDNYDMAAL